ncbi:cytochrome P450 monooxygenase CYP63 [Coprinopsis marcescibilis]|uniref:Cytochrome P450 monooxygenase CYP63 n=1 Tax=Coprinopsis marcescibilis TaxID=230819 RepID=A0A5C3KRS8_COPMA|nr:cytochrome P450 monooxygenase CYP63 [Coprinopsis marcescibilis]
MHPGNYRARVLSDLCQSFLLPVVSARILLIYFDLPLSRLQTNFLSLAAIVAWAILRSAGIDYLQRTQARALQARAIPQVLGRWPGNIDVLFRMMKDFRTSYILDVYLQLFEEYKCTTLNLRILWRDTIISMDQEHSKYVLSTGFHRFWRGRAQKERFETFLGRGIFNRDDGEWRYHRAVARPFFAKERVQDFEIFNKYTTRTMDILTSVASADEAFDAQDLYGRLTLDSASEFLFGKNLDTLSETRPIPGKTSMGPKGSAVEGAWGTFAEAFEAAQQNCTNRARIGHWWPLFELFKDKNEANAQVIHRWLDPLVDMALNSKRESQGAPIGDITQRTFLEHLAQSTDDPSVIRDQLLNMLLASRDTTATVLTYLTYFLALYPDVTEVLRQEVLEHCGQSSPGSHDSFREMKYLRAVLNETLRLFPPVPLNIRQSRDSSFTLPSPDPTYPVFERRPLFMPANTPIIYLPLLTQRNPALWGDDADEFDPERWLDPARLARLANNTAMFMPFSAGPRICIGQNYAYNQMSYFVVRLLQRFDRFTLTPEFQPLGSLPPEVWKKRKGRQVYERVWPAAALTLFAKGGLWMKFHLADQ